jgi:hypothetical protein
MYYGTYDRASRADRYRKVAAEYTSLSKDTTDSFLGSYYLRIAEEYADRSDRERRALQRESVTSLTSAAEIPSPPPRPQRALAQRSHQRVP